MHLSTAVNLNVLHPIYWPLGRLARRVKEDSVVGYKMCVLGLPGSRHKAREEEEGVGPVSCEDQ